MANKDIKREELLRDERMRNVTNYGARYGVAAAVIDYHANEKRPDSGYFIVAGLGQFPNIGPDGMTPKDIQEYWERNGDLCYPYAFAREITQDNIDTVIDSFNGFCQNMEVISALYKQYDCPVPPVMRTSEVGGLVDLNREANNPDRLWSVRACYEKELDRFFANEKKIQKNAGHKEYMEFYRSDRSDTAEPDGKKGLTYYKLKGQQEIPLGLLIKTGASVARACIPEELFQDMRKTLKYSPYVIYSVGKLHKYDMGRIEGPNDPWKNEQRYFEYRDIYFKKVDEPEVASAYIRAKYVDVDTRDSISRDAKITAPALSGRPVARYISPRAIDAFIKTAQMNNLQFTFDYHGILLEPSFDKIPVMVAKQDAAALDYILKDLDNRSFQQHFTENSNLPYLSDTVQIAEIKQSATRGQSQVPQLAGSTRANSGYAR